ncbi:MAG: hypothetical protein HN712_25235, partial [Gemmatimonadetes bacterium]|nr:hypothetical protein [Gemmatimonadota bacterium]
MTGRTDVGDDVVDTDEDQNGKGRQNLDSDKLATDRHVDLSATLIADTLLEVKAGLGANGTGSISADIRGDLQTATGDVSLTAGAQAGDINLQQTTLTAGADAILTAVAGRIDHGEGLLSATNLAVSAADGVTANVLIATIDAVVTGVGDIRIASGDDITLTRLEAADGEIWVDALGSITAVDVVTGGASDANDITLSTFAITGNAADLHVQRLSAGGNGDITLSVQGALLQTLIASGGSPIIADVLEVKVPGAVSLETQVGTVTVHTQSSGDVVITQSGSGRLRVDDTEVADGAFTLNHSAGAADLAQVALLANDDIYDVVVSAGGDIRVGLVSTGPHYTDISDVPAPSLGAEAGVTIHGDVSLTSGGKITELGNDAGADLIGDRLVLQAATGITRLEIAANELVSVTSTSGNVQLTELDGEGEKSVGLLVTLVEATAGSVTVQAHGLMTVANVVAGGVDSIVRLVSESGTLEILEPGTGQPEALQATGGYALVAGDELISYRFFEGPRLVEYRSGGTFSFALPTDITADTIALESGATLTVAGTLTARDRLELISDANVFIDGSEGGRLVAASGSIGHVLIVARGTEQVTATVYDEETNVNTTVTQDTGYIDIETTALPAAQLELRALRDVFVDLSGNLTVNGFVGGVSGTDTAANITLRSDGTLTVGSGTIAATDRLELRSAQLSANANALFVADVLDVLAGGGIVLNTSASHLYLEASGPGNILVTEADAVDLERVLAVDGAINVTAGGTITAIDVRSLTDGAAKSITLKATGDIFVDYIEAAVNAGADKTAGVVNLDATGTIREPNGRIDNDTIDISAFTISFKHGNPLEDIPVVRFIGNAEVGLGTELEVYYIGGNLRNDLSSSDNGGLPTHVDGNYVLNAPNHTGHVSMTVTGNLKVVALGLSPGRFVKLTVGGTLTILPTLDVGASGKMILSAGTGITASGSLTAGSLRLTGAGISVVGSVTANSLTVTSTAGIAVGGSMTANAILLSSAAGITATGGLTADTVTLAAGDHFALNTRANFLTLAQNGTARNASIVEHDGLSLLGASLNGGNLSIVTGGGLDVDGAISGARDATLRANGGAIALNASVTATRNVNLTATGNVSSAAVVTADALIVRSGGAITLPTRVSILDLENSGPTGGILIDQVRAGGLVDVHRLAITHAGNGSHITLSTGNGNLGVAGGGAGVFTRGSGNVTLTANGTGADVVIGASVSATTGAISLQAVDQVTQGANITTSGGSITVAAGGPIEMADGTTALVSGAGSITYTAQGSVSLGVLDTQGHIDVTATGGSIVDNTGGEGANIRAGSATLTAANHIGAAGAADVDTRVTDLRLHSTVAGDIHIGEKNALNLIRAQTTASDIDLTTGGALAIGDIISPHNVRITAGGPVSNSGKVQAIDLTVVAVGAIQLNTEVITLSAENTGATGAITITELNGGGAIRVQLLKQSQVSNSDQIQLHTQSGAIRVVASGQGVHHLGSGSIDLSAAGNVNIGQVISSQAGAITITAQTAITQNANITTQGGAINLTANDGRISQDRGTQASVTGSGTITLTATGDVRLNRVVTSGHADVTAGSGPSTGSIVDVSDEIESANLEASTAILLADVGIGGLGDDDLDTALDYLEAEAGSGGIWVDNLGNLVVGEISAVEGLTTAGPIVVSTAGSLSIREDVTSAANIDLSATAGDVGVIDGSSVLAATNANLLASGSIAIDGSYVTATAGMADLDAQGGQLSLINASMVTAFSSITGNAGTDLTIDSGSGAVAGDDAVLTAGNDLHLTATSTVQAQDLIAILGDHGNSDPGIGSSIQLQGILDGQRVEVSGEKDADSILLQLVNLVGHTQIFGQAGDDLITIDHLVTLITAHDRPADGVTGAVQDTVDIDGGEGADDVVVNVTAGRTEYIVNVHDTGTIGADADVLTINGTQPLDANHGSGNDLWLLRERFVAYMTPQVSLAAGVPPGTLHPEMERINYDGTINGRLQINSLGGDDQFYVDDNSSPTTLNSGNGADRFQIGQLFESERSAAAGIAPEDVFATVEVTRGLLSNGISHATSIVSGAGSDEFVVYHNLAALDLNGGGGDDRFEFRTFALAGSDESSAVAYVDNGPVQVDADGSSDSLLVIGTEFGDDLIVAEDLIAGAGLAVSYAAVESLEIDSAEGDDDIFVLSIGLDVTTNLLGGLGSDDFSIAGDAGTVDGATSWLSAQSGSHTTDVIRGVLTIDGFGGVGSVGRLVTAVTLPDETNLNPVPRDLHTNFSADETAALDTVTVYNDGSSTADVGTLAAASLLGLGMTPAGITYGNFEVVEVLLGTGNDDFRIDNTADGAITAVHGGGGDDLITANGRGGVDSRGYDAPLVIFGDTSQDGGRYDGIAGVPSPGDAWSFGNAGADTIDASASVQNVTIYGGIGEDVIDGGQAGDHLAGGSGNDTIHGHDGLDHLYGDSGVNVELATRVLTIPTVDDSSAPSRDPLGVGADTLSGDNGADLILGDHGVITQTTGTERILTTANVERIETVRPSDGGADRIFGGSDFDVILGGNGADFIKAGTDSAGAVVIGDSGSVTFGPLFPAVANVTTSDPTHGGADTITTGDGDDIVAGGYGADIIAIAGGSNTVLGDHGVVTFQEGTSILASVVSINLSTGGQTFLPTGSDTISTGLGNDVVIGGLGNDEITVAGGDNIILGDDGAITFQATSGLTDRIESRYLDGAGASPIDASEAVVGNDTISTGSGDDVVLAGLGDDVVTILDGANVVLGDEGFAQYQDQADTSGTAVLGTVSSQYLDGAMSFVQGGADSITTGDGDDTVIAGLGNDDITVADGANIVLGDGGSITYQLTSGLRDRIESRYLDDAGFAALDATEAVVGNDTISTGSGDDVVLAGLGDDVVTILDGANVVLGDEGFAQYQDQADTSGTA